MIRTIIKADEKTITLTLPENYIGKKVEIIAFAVDEVALEIEEIGESNHKTFNALELDTIGFKFNRDEANER